MQLQTAAWWRTFDPPPCRHFELVSGTDAEQPEMQIWPAACTVARFSRATMQTSTMGPNDKDRIAVLDRC